MPMASRPSVELDDVVVERDQMVVEGLQEAEERAQDHVGDSQSRSIRASTPNVPRQPVPETRSSPRSWSS
jgi:hypothetical protein